jgi:hypothetical protein
VLEVAEYIDLLLMLLHHKESLLVAEVVVVVIHVQLSITKYQIN